jgi:hypothetical protein
MKKIGKSSNMYVMLALLAVLFVSLAFLSVQSSKEGFYGFGKKKEGLDGMPSGMPTVIKGAMKAGIVDPKKSK